MPKLTRKAREVPVDPSIINALRALVGETALSLIEALEKKGVFDRRVVVVGAAPGIMVSAEQATDPEIRIDQSVIDVGVETAGLERGSEGPLGVTETAKGSPVSSTVEQLKNLKKGKG